MLRCNALETQNPLGIRFSICPHRLHAAGYDTPPATYLASLVSIIRHHHHGSNSLSRVRPQNMKAIEKSRRRASDVGGGLRARERFSKLLFIRQLLEPTRQDVSASPDSESSVPRQSSSPEMSLTKAGSCPTLKETSRRRNSNFDSATSCSTAATATSHSSLSMRSSIHSISVQPANDVPPSSKLLCEWPHSSNTSTKNRDWSLQSSTTTQNSVQRPSWKERRRSSIERQEGPNPFSFF